MSCSDCGKNRGHMPDCPSGQAASQRAGRSKGSKKGLLRGNRPPVCRTCEGDGTVVDRWKDGKGIWRSASKTCPDCKGSGTIGE